MLISISAIIRESCSLYGKHFRAVVPYIVLIFLPSALIAISGYAALFVGELTAYGDMASNIVLGIMLLAALIFHLWTSTALLRFTGLLAEGGNIPHWKTVYGSVIGRLWPFVYTSILTTIIVSAGFILFIIPGLIFTVWYAFVGFTLVIEGAKGFNALRASKALVVGRWWSILWRLFIPAAIFTLLFAVLQRLLLWPVGALLTGDAEIIVGNLIVFLFQSLFAPLSLLSVALLYHSAKTNPLPPPPPETPVS